MEGWGVEMRVGTVGLGRGGSTAGALELGGNGEQNRGGGVAVGALAVVFGVGFGSEWAGVVGGNLVAGAVALDLQCGVLPGRALAAGCLGLGAESTGEMLAGVLEPAAGFLVDEPVKRALGGGEQVVGVGVRDLPGLDDLVVAVGLAAELVEVLAGLARSRGSGGELGF
jgi:hypothetical protein